MVTGMEPFDWRIGLTVFAAYLSIPKGIGTIWIVAYSTPGANRLAVSLRRTYHIDVDGECEHAPGVMGILRRLLRTTGRTVVYVQVEYEDNPQ